MSEPTSHELSEFRRRYPVYRDRYSGSYLFVGKGHSWGSFKTKALVRQWRREVILADRKFKEKHRTH